MRLSELPGYQELGGIDSLDAYFTQKKNEPGIDDPGAYLSGVVLQGADLSVSPEEMARLASEGRDALIRRQGAAPYVASLSRRLLAACANEDIFTAPVESTALTSLFRDRYGVDLTPYMQQSTNEFRITGASDRGEPVVGLNYMAVRQTEARTHGNIFWQLVIDGNYGFVNMYCSSHDFPQMPLEGWGNVANVPGVEEALTADVAFIENNNRSTT